MTYVLRVCRWALLASALLTAMPSGCGGHSLSSMACPPGLSACYGSCTDTRLDPTNCGACGVFCEYGTTCQSGSCSSLAVPDGGYPESSWGSGDDADATMCNPPNLLCGSACTDPATDPANCGFCTNACPLGQSCVASNCVQGCVAPAQDCAGACLDTQDDPMNCGSCGHACSAGQACNGGSCGAPCPGGGAFCNGTCTTLQTDDANCGGCAIACASGQVCTAGLCSRTASIWPTLGSDIHHTGFNPVEAGKPPLTSAWTASVGFYPTSVVSDGNMIYVSARSVAATSDYVLSALSLADGHALWTHDFKGVGTLGQPTVEDGHVYVAEGNGSPGTFMHSIAAGTGAVEWSEAFADQIDTFWAPLVVGGRIYFEGGEYGGLYALVQATGSEVFFANEDQVDSWSPLFLDNRIYTFTKGHLRTFDVAAGSVVTSTDVSFTGFSNSMNTSPVSDGTSVYIISPPSLYAFAPSLGAPLWTASGAYSSQPAIANGVLYSISGGQLQANDAATGAALWTFAGDKALTYPPVVAAGYVYVASDTNAYAVDSVKHTQAWTAKPGGWLSIAAGRLLVASNNGTVVAWSLTQ